MSYKETPLKSLQQNVLGIWTLALLLTSACSTKVSEKEITKVLEDNPSIIVKAIEKNAQPILEALTKASQELQEKRQDESRKAEETSREEEFKNPKKPKLADTYNYRGPKNAKIVIVEYSDFQCPFCSRGYETVRDVLKKYPNDIRLTYKHLPLAFHEQAMISAQYYEAAAIQDKEKAWKLHDKIFENQRELAGGEAWLKKIAQEVGLDVKKLEKDAKSESVDKKIKEDMAEAGEFGFQGTPGFLINGISLRGAYPAEEFSKIIDKLLSSTN